MLVVYSQWRCKLNCLYLCLYVWMSTNLMVKVCVCGVLGADLLKLTREDVIQICGPADGIRLFNVLKGRWVYSPGNRLTCTIVVHPHVLILCECCWQGGASQADHLRLPGVSADTRAAGETWKRGCCHQHLLWLVDPHWNTFDWAASAHFWWSMIYVGNFGDTANCLCSLLRDKK